MSYTLEDVRRAQPHREGFIDNFVADVFYRRLSRYVTWLVARTPLTPVSVVWLGFLVGCGGVALFATGDYVLALIGIAVIHASNVLDCVDGELARLTNRVTSYGRWLDFTLDLLLELLMVAGLAWGIHRAAPSDELLIVAFLGLVATAMMYFASAWSAHVFGDVVEAHEDLKRGLTHRVRAIIGRIHPMLLSYSGDMRNAILTVFLAFDAPWEYLIVAAVIGNLYWMARLWLYRGR